MNRRTYIGLAVTEHDPALAVVDHRGEVVYAEATERHLQLKRAWYSTPDTVNHISGVIGRWVDVESEVVAARSWSYTGARRLRDRAALGFYETDSFQAWQRFWYRKEARLPDAAYVYRAIGRAMFAGGLNTQDLAARNLEYRLTERKPAAPPLVHRGYEHHLCHAAAACYSSPFESALCAVVDGNGEDTSTSFYRYERGRIEKLPESLPSEGSLGELYQFLCAACGFDPVKGEEWKVMGLAPYGKLDAVLYERLRPLLSVDGLSIGCDDRFTQAWYEMWPGPKDPYDAADLAHTGQVIFSEICGELLRNLHAIGGSDNLVYTGGCALNSAWNGRILQETPFEALHVNSAPGDDGCALGAAWLAYYEDHPPTRAPARRLSPYLGSELVAEVTHRVEVLGGIENVAGRHGPPWKRAASLLADGKIVAWARGRAEYGPRALGNRSILADPRRPDIKEAINARVKFREEFRPFAPSILDEAGPDYFEDYQTTPYMERALRFRTEVIAKVPGVVHVDGTGRLQSVLRELNEDYYRLIREFADQTDVPLVLNTSFNVMGRPIVHSVEDAIAVFFTTGIDALVVGDAIFEKS